MKYEIPIEPLPGNLVISDVLTEDEQPKVFMKIIQLKAPKKGRCWPGLSSKICQKQQGKFHYEKERPDDEEIWQTHYQGAEEEIILVSVMFRVNGQSSMVNVV